MLGALPVTFLRIPTRAAILVLLVQNDGFTMKPAHLNKSVRLQLLPDAELNHDDLKIEGIANM